MKRHVSLLLPMLAAVLIAGCATAPSTTEQQLAAYESDGVVCREILVIGSNQLRRVCGTTEQWDRYDDRQAASARALTTRLQGSLYSDE